MRNRTGAVRRLVGVLVASAVPVAGIALPAHAAPSVNITISDVSLAEGSGAQMNFIFTISASGLRTTSATVQWATASGTATSGTDFVAASGQVTLAKSSKTVKVTVKVNGDLLDEPNETFSVLLSNAVGGTITDGTGIGTIGDDDATPSLAVGDGSASEGDGTVDVTVALSAASGRTVTVDYATSDDTALAGEDYDAASGSLTFTPGATTQVVTVALLDDAWDEANEAFFFGISSPVNATIADASGDVTVADDDATPGASASDVTVGEADGTASFQVTLSGTSASTVTIDYATADGTALAGADYTAASGTLTFLPGETSATVDVSVTDDATDEPTQDFTLQFSNASNVAIDDTAATGSILDDDGGPWVSVTGATVSETAGTVEFTLTLDGASQQNVSVDYATSDGTALTGSDYTATSGALTFLAGETVLQVSVPVLDDSAYEAIETFGLNLSNGSGLSIDDGSATAKVTSNDKAPTSITLTVRKGKAGVKARGKLTYAKAGMSVRVSLLKRVNGSWKKVTGKTVSVTNIRDRNADGIKEGIYRASFERPKSGKYRITAVFTGNPRNRPCHAKKDFTI